MVIESDGEFQESYTPHLLHVLMGEVLDSRDAQGILRYHEVLGTQKSCNEKEKNSIRTFGYHRDTQCL